MTLRIIGFNDEVKKGPGPATHFRPEDCFHVLCLPTQHQLREYATAKGYLPRNGRGVHPTKCEPVYLEVRDVR